MDGSEAQRGEAAVVCAGMDTALLDLADRVLGLNRSAEELEFRHMTARAVIAFGFGVVLARLADRRFMGQNAGFDIMLVVVLGSVLSRGVNGDAAFFPTLGASAVLVLLHRLLGTLALRFHPFSELVKGRPETLVRRGVVDHAAMRRHKITPDDLDENLRLHGNVSGTADVEEARVERNGSISVVKTSNPDRRA